MKNKYINHICFLLVFFTLAGFGQSAWAQTITASGKVLDRNQEPLIGANVKVLDTATGTITNPDGHFTLECPKGSILEVSFIGYVSQKGGCRTEPDHRAGRRCHHLAGDGHRWHRLRHHA
ncbi:carboxypeptidase-like regulatory domain-containing protein [Bacteroides sp. BFG-257]|uniref:carboxypeptidase-like regulatory domain-containing protein n=1 Tax=Bacteroides sp. BFG-257 TaxID=2972761 RepID=UPI002162F495|nr:carboxypeptidase-like regulatory domain-containing protein [Bacteroides sp. BFG-257]UVO99722.1 carboxypeptidase-like regulatory domain-containing protein [Bacteroides sp. BFG-257]